MSDFLEGKLDNQEIRQMLSEHKYSSGFKPSEELLDDIIEKFWFHDFITVLYLIQFFWNTS